MYLALFWQSFQSLNFPYKVIKIPMHIVDHNLEWIIQHLLVLVIFSTNGYYNVHLKNEIIFLRKGKIHLSLLTVNKVLEAPRSTQINACQLCLHNSTVTLDVCQKVGFDHLSCL